MNRGLTEKSQSPAAGRQHTEPDGSRGMALPSATIDQIVGQPDAVALARLAARQQRHLLVLGEPGTGKSLLGQAIAELLSVRADAPQVTPDNAAPATRARPADLIACANPTDPLLPRLKSLPAGTAQTHVETLRRKRERSNRFERFLLYTFGVAALILGTYFFARDGQNWLYLAAIPLVWLGLGWLGRRLRRRGLRELPRILVQHGPDGADDPTGVAPPYVDATGSQSGALLGDVRHDPYQSGGAETPPHALLEAGALHRAHGGVLYIDELSTLSPESQQQLLQALQQREIAITGRSTGSSGTMVRSNPAPCDVLLVIAGNPEDLTTLHPALRSRLRGYGYEIWMRSDMPIDAESTAALQRFVAQEVARDGRIPHFDGAAVAKILEAAQLPERQQADDEPVAQRYTLRLRDLGGLVRLAGDLAIAAGADLVTQDHVRRAVALRASNTRTRARHAQPEREFNPEPEL